MAKRTCEYCGTPINLLRQGARFCSTKHRVYASRKPSFPREMTSKDRWMRWIKATRGERTTKRPVTASGIPASSTDAGTWSTYAGARNSTVGAGLGFALGDGIGCIDLDHCIENGVVADWARSILDLCPETFVEVSQSGTGLHIFGLLAEQPGRNIRRGGESIEFYSVGRFIALTGNRFEGAPSHLGDLTEVVELIR